MELVHDFSVPVPADQAWDLLTDVERIAPCLPGAAITSVDGDDFEGGMKVKVGPIGMTFKGGGSFVEKNATDRRAVIEAKGRDAKGNGGAQATVTATLDEHDGVTDVHVVTNLNVTGKAAQFGGGVLKDISNRMLAQFATHLSQVIQAGAPGDSAGPGAASTAGVSATAAPRPSLAAVPASDSVDALGLLVGSDALAKVIRPVAVGLTGLLVGYLYGKNRTLERIVGRAF
jgi:carbon monoxide dehydrogenase subunit G